MTRDTVTTIALAVAGVAIVVVILWDAFETILVPRRIGGRTRFTTIFYIWTWRAWRGMARPIRATGRRESLLAHYAPLSILLLLASWAAAMVIAFAMLHAAAGTVPPGARSRVATLLYLSGETFFTLGYGDITPTTSFGRLVSVLEAGMGFGFFATVIGYLPTLYGAFSRREIEVLLLDARAGSPPAAAEIFRRMPDGGGPQWLDTRLRSWERWSAEILESTISYPLLAYYRSQHSNQSWLGSLTVILDTSALVLAGLDGLEREQAQLTFATARHALVDLTQIFVPHYAAMPDRLPPDELERVHAVLATSPVRVSDRPSFDARLTELRQEYEPYAQALAAHLLIDLPGWVHRQERHDNWQGAPWDRAIGARRATAVWDQDHF